ncbi:hypothetical protein BKA65DRAFT_422649 [Rhexocercosporidium sp. MPI-PUGE-AT-0058]|nr:hypothetical protein BKA65DRAFT_422649 [Rhexocercosporidium sp. MPI-PUGE-AT-0058]
MPPVFQPFDEATASRGQLQPPPVHADNPPLIPGDVCVGCIVWLPPKDVNRPSIRCVNESCCGKRELDDGGHNHPVVVLKIRQKKGSIVIGDLICTVASVTTFSGTSLSKYLSRRRRRQASIPIFDPEATALTSPRAASLVQLKMEDGRLKKQSYIRLQHTYRIPVSMLGQYAYRNSRAYKRRLSYESYCALMELLSLPPEKYEVTASLYETENQRLLDLARSSLPSVVQAHRAAHPVTNPTHPSHYGGGGTIPARPQAAGYIPPAHTYPQIRYHREPESHGDGIGGGGGSFVWKCVAGVVIVGLAWWNFWRTPSTQR